MPVVGATYPMRSSSAAFDGSVRPKATTPPNNGGPTRRSKVIVIVLLPCCRDIPAQVRRSQVPFFSCLLDFQEPLAVDGFASGCPSAPLVDTGSSARRRRLARTATREPAC